MSAAERASEASSADQVNEWAVRANERMAEYSTRRFLGHVTHCAMSPVRDNKKSEIAPH